MLRLRLGEQVAPQHHAALPDVLVFSPSSLHKNERARKLVHLLDGLTRHADSFDCASAVAAPAFSVAFLRYDAITPEACEL